MCIKEGKWKNRYSHEIVDGPEYGNIYVVIDTILSNGRYHYLFAEWAPRRFNVSEFIPLSTIDETELVNQREKTEPCAKQVLKNNR